jgi:hypothetical protein
MSLLLQRKGPAAPLPRLEGKEVLVGPNPDAAKVKGVMFGGRKQFLTEVAGEEGFAAIIAKLTPRTASYTKTPLASSWCEFASLIELDRTAYETLKQKYPNVLALIGAASAELGIGRVYKSLDSTELVKFMESQAPIKRLTAAGCSATITPSTARSTARAPSASTSNRSCATAARTRRSSRRNARPSAIRTARSR